MKSYYFGPHVKGTEDWENPFNTYWLRIFPSKIEIIEYKKFDGFRPVECETILEVEKEKELTPTEKHKFNERIGVAH